MNSTRTPWMTLSLAAAAVLAHLIPALGDAWQYQRVAIAEGEWWRLLAGHLTHWNPDHLLWDLAVFASLGAWIESTSRRRQYALLLLASGLAISAGVWCLQPEMATYRGLSGIDSALFGLLAARVGVQKCRAGDWAPLAGVSLLLVGFTAKTIYEAAFGATLFVDSAQADFAPVPLAHLIGAGVGLGCAVIGTRDHGSQSSAGNAGVAPRCVTT